MPGLAAMALAAAPLAGGAMLGGWATGTTGPDLRATIKEDLELLARLPEDQVARRVALLDTVGARIDALIAADERRREFRRKTRYFTYFTENWRDVLVFVSAVLFALVCWVGDDHHRWYWLPTFVAAILMATVTGFFVVRGFIRSVRAAPQPRPRSIGR